MGNSRANEKTMSDNYKLIDNEDRCQYEFHIDGYIAKIEYKRSGKGEISLTHTEVPAGLEGQGIGSQLVEKVLKDIDRKNLRLIPLCPFVAAYIEKHPEWKRLVMKEMDDK